MKPILNFNNTQYLVTSEIAVLLNNVDNMIVNASGITFSDISDNDIILLSGTYVGSVIRALRSPMKVQLGQRPENDYVARIGISGYSLIQLDWFFRVFENTSVPIASTVSAKAAPKRVQSNLSDELPCHFGREPQRIEYDIALLSTNIKRPLIISSKVIVQSQDWIYLYTRSTQANPQKFQISQVNRINDFITVLDLG